MNIFIEDVSKKVMEKLAGGGGGNPGFFNGVWTGAGNVGDAYINGWDAGLNIINPYISSGGKPGIINKMRLYGLPLSKKWRNNFVTKLDRLGYNIVDYLGQASNPDAGFRYRFGRGVGTAAGYMPIMKQLMMAKSLLTKSHINPGLSSLFRR